MARGDLQVGDSWTDPGYRGRGLALHAVRQVLARTACPGRVFWYVVNEENAASIRVAEKAGFVHHATGVRTARLGVRLLGDFRITGGPLPARVAA
jgi:RimJ/RimL family protein N-acetyltransferase